MKKYFFIALMAGISACHSSLGKPAASEGMQPKRISWEWTTTTTRQLASEVRLPGELKPFESVQIFPKVNGFVKEVLVDRGSQVKKGQVLLRLEAPEMEQQLIAARLRYLQQYTVFISDKDRFNRLAATSKTPGTVAPFDLEAARAKMVADSAIMEGEQANYRATEAVKNYLTVLAPFDGVITERNVHPGALVGPGVKMEDKAMLVLEQENKLRLVVNIPEVYCNQINRKSEVNFKVNAIPEKKFRGRVNRDAGALNMKFRSETVEIDVENARHELKPGMYAEVILPVSRPVPSLVVPKSAVVTSTERKYVIMLDSGKTRWVDVEEGNTKDDLVEVFGALKPGDQIVKKASDEIKEGMQVN